MRSTGAILDARECLRWPTQALPSDNYVKECTWPIWRLVQKLSRRAFSHQVQLVSFSAGFTWVGSPHVIIHKGEVEEIASACIINSLWSVCHSAGFQTFYKLTVTHFNELFATDERCCKLLQSAVLRQFLEPSYRWVKLIYSPWFSWTTQTI